MEQNSIPSTKVERAMRFVKQVRKLAEIISNIIQKNA